jgi:hypothetical protein
LIDWLKSVQVANKIDPASADLEISKLILSGEPGLIGRLGGTEARFLGEYLKIVNNRVIPKKLLEHRPTWIKRSKEINSNAGYYFSSTSEISKFYELYDLALRETDILGAWGTAFAWVESKYIGDKLLVPIGSTSPWVIPYSSSKSPLAWSYALQGKKVLVISPFVDTIKIQFSRINKVFSASYPNFDLQLIKAPQTIGFPSNSIPTWENNLNSIKTLMEKSTFDIALVSAGSYSYPVAHFAKQMGKVGIHAGGGLQLFFGILGKRWDNDVYYTKFTNEYWTRPSTSETPKSFKSVEDGCYW